jgi:THO complex subunit 1
MAAMRLTVLQSAKFAKDMDFDARYILVKPASAESHTNYLKAAGSRDEAEIKAIVDSVPAMLEGLNADNVAGKVVLNEDIAKASQELDDYLYQKDADAVVDTSNGTGRGAETTEPNGAMDVDAPEAS